MTNNILNKTNDYNKNYYEGNGYISFSDYINNKPDKVHNSLYKAALESFIKEYNYNYDEFKFYEFKNEEYDYPSKVKVVHNVYPYFSKIYDLAPYWNYNSINKKLSKKLNNIKVNNIKINDWVIEYIDYARGTVIIYSKMYDITKEVNFDDIDYKKFYSLRNNKLTDTFTKLHKLNTTTNE